MCRCNGLILLETYSALDNGALKKCLPKFLPLVEEVTGNPAYSMFNLSLREEWGKTNKFCSAFTGKYKHVVTRDVKTQHGPNRDPSLVGQEPPAQVIYKTNRVSGRFAGGTKNSITLNMED